MRQIEDRRRSLTAQGRDGWARMMSEWQADGPDAMWLMYSADYLLRTAGLRWAIDPVRLTYHVAQAGPVPTAPLADLDLVVLTHNHHDHVDEELLRELSRHDDTRWVVPHHMREVIGRCCIRQKRVIVPQPMRSVAVGPLRLTAFEGLHWEYPGRWGEGAPVAGIDASGYLAEWSVGREGANGRRRLLIPGDTRTYDGSALPDFGPVDTVLAHVWLGRGAALEPDPPRLGELCGFIAALRPTEKVVLGHLEEVSREPEDYWSRGHADQVRRRLAEMLQGVAIEAPELWSAVTL